ncbi:hypothetical protein BGZ70_005670 [Mortierella alpina]|uniref:Uncharacterized protein n=1 Tax=Mortierella alpina TaxID=64518 RepID=A0A9P6J8U8_MORAP|nr:hypothetical protein BGZ70_005670 [Mortierella alpina]
MSRSIVSQRRVSLPCIIESPTSPTGPATPRHSCDLGRSPMHAEPLHTRTTSGALPMRRDCMPATPKTNTVSTASLLTTQPQTSAGHQLNSDPKHQTSKQKSASLQQRSHLDKAASSGLFAGVPEAISNNVSRRRSIDISALSGLSSRTSLHLRRQKSLDLLRASQAPVAAPVAVVAAEVADATASSTDPAVADNEGSRPPESKVRRDSDASTSETIASGQSSCTTLVAPMVQALDDGKPPVHVQDATARTSSDLGQQASPMARSASQPPLSHTSVTAARRSASASEPGVRQSFDLRLFAGRDRLGMEDEHEVLNKNRRRSIHDPLFTMKEEPDFMSSSPRNEALSHLNRKGSSSSSSKSRGSFSGSATVSGRFSRFLWYGSDHQVKDHAASLSNGPSPGPGSDHSFWSSSLGDLAEASSAEATNQETGERKLRHGMMNRLSGIWSRR